MPFMNPFAVLVGILFVVMVAWAVVIIPENHRGAVVRLGRYFKTLRPGLNVRIPVIDLVTKVDLDASIPGWQGFTEAELAAAVESFVTLGTAARVKSPRSGRNRPALSSRSPGAPEAQALVAWLVKSASAQIGADLTNDQMAKDRIAESARGAIEELRSSDSCEIHLPFLTADRTGPKHYSCSLTRSQLDEIVGDGI